MEYVERIWDAAYRYWYTHPLNIVRSNVFCLYDKANGFEDKSFTLKFLAVENYFLDPRDG